MGEGKEEERISPFYIWYEVGKYIQFSWEKPTLHPQKPLKLPSVGFSLSASSRCGLLPAFSKVATESCQFGTAFGFS